MANAVDFGDVQGVVRYGYKHMTEACYYLLRIKDAAAARAWLRTAPISSAAESKPPPSVATQVAFTARGLDEVDGRGEVWTMRGGTDSQAGLLHR